MSVAFASLGARKGRVTRCQREGREQNIARAQRELHGPERLCSPPRTAAEQQAEEEERLREEADDYCEAMGHYPPGYLDQIQKERWEAKAPQRALAQQDLEAACLELATVKAAYETAQNKVFAASRKLQDVNAVEYCTTCDTYLGPGWEIPLCSRCFEDD
jgi:hypothetical protein